MKKIVITLLVVLSSFVAQSQEVDWQINVKKAVEISKKTKKPRDSCAIPVVFPKNQLLGKNID